MNVKELKEVIQDLPDNMEIILQKDSEGNGYSPLAGVDPDCIYEPETTWGGEVYALEHGAEGNGFEEDEWQEILDNFPKTLVLFPVS